MVATPVGTLRLARLSLLRLLERLLRNTLLRRVLFPRDKHEEIPMRTALLGFAALIATVVSLCPNKPRPGNLFSTIGIAQSAAAAAAAGFRIAPTAPGSSAAQAPAALASTAPKIRSGSRARQVHGFSGGSQFDGRAAREAGVVFNSPVSAHHFDAHRGPPRYRSCRGHARQLGSHQSHGHG